MKTNTPITSARSAAASVRVGEYRPAGRMQMLLPPSTSSVSLIFFHVEVAGVRLSYLIALALSFVVLLPWLRLAVVALVRGYNVSKCPRCRSLRIRPSAFKFMDKILDPTHIKPFRCEWCYKRFYAMTRKRVAFPKSPSLSG
jgi:hypothetical protein